MLHTRLHRRLMPPLLALAGVGVMSSLLVGAPPAGAQGGCTITAPGVSLGTSTGSAVDGIATLTVTCPNGTAYTLTLDAGLYFDGSTRNVGAGPSRLPYKITQDAAGNVEWGDTGDAGTYPFGSGVGATGTGALQSFNAYVKVPAFDGLAYPTGTYGDTVQAEVVF